MQYTITSWDDLNLNYSNLKNKTLKVFEIKPWKETVYCFTLYNFEWIDSQNLKYFDKFILQIIN